jgi:hypothetical protein
VQKSLIARIFGAAVLAVLLPHHVLAQGAPGNVPAPARQAAGNTERAARRFGMGVQGGIGLDPELIEFGAHGRFGPIFRDNLSFRPGLAFGVGEVTTVMSIDLDVLYTMPGGTRSTGWTPYVGAGPTFGLSHRGFTADDPAHTDTGNRFNFSDTDFVSGLNLIAGAHSQGRWFFEMKATAYGVSNVKLLVGVNF